MGQSMCGHLLQAGYSVTVYSLTRKKAAELDAKGSHWADTPAGAAENSDVIISMVGYPRDVTEVHLGLSGTLSRAKPGAVLIDMTTSSPGLAQSIAQQAHAQGVVSLDAPVSGGDIGARNATLSIMVGGDHSAFAALMPIWNTLGKTVVHQGNAGAGQHTKMMNQILIATNMIGVCESLLYAYRAGLNLETAMQSVSSGAAGSWSLTNLGPRIIKQNFDPGFFVDHFVKDMGIALDEANRMGLSLPGLALAKQLYVALQGQGGGALGTHALQLALARLSGIDWQNRK